MLYPVALNIELSITGADSDIAVLFNFGGGGGGGGITILGGAGVDGMHIIILIKLFKSAYNRLLSLKKP